MALALALIPLLTACKAYAQNPRSATGEGWPTYGGDAGGQRYSSAAQITRQNVRELAPAWVYHTGALQAPSLSVSKSDFEATPILFGGLLYLTTPFDRVIALDPTTGAERWTFDPKLANDLQTSNYTSRGVAAWADANTTHTAACSRRIYVATLDARLIAVDAETGAPCGGFGRNGQVDLKKGIRTNAEHPYFYFGNTSPPTVVGDVVVVGSAIGDNIAIEAEPGVVRGFDARTGKLLWWWDPLPWSESQHPRTSAGNAWSVIAADVQHGLVYVPTGAPSPDFYGGLRVGDDRDANSIVALDARTGRKVWAFQLVHHDVWDYDVAAEPLLFDFHGTPAVAVAAKTGILFVLNRLTGEPLVPIQERAVPQGGVLGEKLSPTQPFSRLPTINALTFDPEDLTGLDSESARTCEAQLHKLRYDGIFTPPTLVGTLQYPGSLGGVNWGSMSLDPLTGVLYANTNGSAYEIRLLKRPGFMALTARLLWVWIVAAALSMLLGALLRRRVYPGSAITVFACALIAAGLYFQRDDTFHFERRHNMVNSPDSVGELSANSGAPYQTYRRVLQDDAGHPCTPQPWGSTGAVDLAVGKLLWRKPLGTMIASEHTGTVNFGAPIVTAGGMLFTAASSEPLLRAIDKDTGDELWTGHLPVPAQSTPMTYMAGGRQYVVVCAGGHGGLGTPLGDSVVAFALPNAGGAGVRMSR